LTLITIMRNVEQKNLPVQRAASSTRNGLIEYVAQYGLSINYETSALTEICEDECGVYEAPEC
jgi:hypothetical protein